MTPHRIAVCCSALLIAGLAPAFAQSTVAIFADDQFPVYGTYTSLTPELAAQRLQAAGIEAELLSAARVADPAELNRQRYAAYIHLYGNTFPALVMPNLRRFHQAGGCILSTGVPFCHACVPAGSAQWRADPEGHETCTSRLEDDAHSGAAAMRVSNPGGQWVGFTGPRLAVEPGQTLTLSGWARTRGNLPDRDWLFLRFFDAGGAFIKQEGPALPVDAAGWTFIQQTVTVPPGASQADISVQVWSPKSTVDLDDLTLTRDASGDNLCPNPGFEEPGGGWLDVGHTGVHFTHHEGLGLGSFLGPGPAEHTYALAPANPWSLDDRCAAAASGLCQWLNPASLAPGDEVVPIIEVTAGANRGAPVAGIRHHCPDFPGAVDVWLGTQLFIQANLQCRSAGLQIVLRGTAWALKEQGLLTEAQFAQIVADDNARPWPPPEPSNLEIPDEPRPYPTFFPKSNPLGDRLVVADVRPLPIAERYLLSALQGLANRGTPEVYLIFTEMDEFWLTQMLEKGYVKQVERVADPMSLLERYRDVYEGVVIGDPQLMVSNNITCMVAGVRNLLPATPELADRLGLPVKEDLRGRFSTNVEAFRWAFDTMLPRLDHFYGICAHPNLAYGGNFDTYVQHKGICLWITGEKDGRLPGADSMAERQFFAELFAKLPTQAVYRGFWWHGDGTGLGEGPGVEFGGDYGKITVVTDAVPNISVHSAIRIDALKQKPFPAPPKLDPTKSYCAFTMSDGDNLNTLFSFFQGYFNHPLHGQIPMGWGMGPSIIDLMPAVAEWYYDRQLPADEFLADVSGVGYVFPQTFGRRYRDRERVLSDYLDWTSLYMGRMDEHTVRPHGGDRAVLQLYADRIAGLHSIFADYGRRGLPYDQANYFLGDTPVLHAATLWNEDDEWFCDQLRHATAKRPAFFNVFLCNWFFPWERIQRIQELLGPEYVWVTPSQLAALYREAEGRATSQPTPDNPGAH